MNVDQRRIPLTVSQNGASASVTLPTSVNTLPPGSYALQTVDAKGVPSPSQTITLNAAGTPGTVTVYEPQTATGGGTGGGTTGGTVPLTVGSVIGLEASNYPGYRVRHEAYGARIDPLSTDSDPIDRAGSSFVVRAGLAGSGVSFESVDQVGLYLRAPGGGAPVTLTASDGSAAFDRAATFVPVDGLAGQGTSFQLYDDRTAYLRHQNYVLRSAVFNGSSLARADSTFRVKTGLSPLARGARIGLQPADRSGSLIRHQGYVAKVAVIGAGSSALAKADSTFVVRAPLNGSGCVSLESVNFPGYYLRVSGAGVRLDRGDGTAQFAADASFCPVTGLSGANLTLRTSTDRADVITADASTVSVTTFTGSEPQRSAGTLVVRPGLG